MSLTRVDECVADARADHDRQGGLTSDDLNRLTSRYQLEALEVVAVVGALQSFGIEVEESVDLNFVEGISKSNDSLGRMLYNAGRVPLLTAAEEVKLGRRIEAGQKVASLPPEERNAQSERVIRDGKSAHDHLVLANMRLVVSLARRYPTSGMELADLIQEGMLGVMRAADKYDHSLGYKFSTYATWWIRQSITRGMADKSRLIRLPVHFVETVAKMRQTAAQLERSLNRSPTLHELASSLQMDPGKVQAVQELSREPMSIDELFPDSDTELVEILNLYSSSVEDEVMELMSRAEVAAALGKFEVATQARSGAGGHAAAIIRLRFGLEDGEIWTLDAIGAKYGVTRERVRQIIEKSMKSDLLQKTFSNLNPKSEYANES